MPLMLLLTVLFAWAVSGRRLLRVRRVPAWRSATIGVYRPAFGFFMAIVTAAKRLQSGRLDAYLLYMLIALIAVIATVSALA
jgi:hypothetical protein